MTVRFKNIKKCLNDFENVLNGENVARGYLNEEEQNIADSFEFNLAQALIKDRNIDEEKVAKFIFVIKNLPNQIKVRIE